jgi:hypothetical protein
MENSTQMSGCKGKGKELPSPHNPRNDILRGQYLYHFVRCNGLTYIFKIATISSSRAQ